MELQRAEMERHLLLSLSLGQLFFTSFHRPQQYCGRIRSPFGAVFKHPLRGMKINVTPGALSSAAV